MKDIIPIALFVVFVTLLLFIGNLMAKGMDEQDKVEHNHYHLKECLEIQRNTAVTSDRNNYMGDI